MTFSFWGISLQAGELHSITSRYTLGRLTATPQVCSHVKTETTYKIWLYFWFYTSPPSSFVHTSICSATFQATPFDKTICLSFSCGTASDSTSEGYTCTTLCTCSLLYSSRLKSTMYVHAYICCLLHQLFWTQAVQKSQNAVRRQQQQLLVWYRLGFNAFSCFVYNKVLYKENTVTSATKACT